MPDEPRAPRSLWEDLNGIDAGRVSQCAHMYRSGRRCRLAAMDGVSTTCRTHGGDVSTLDTIPAKMQHLLEVALETHEELLLTGDDKVRIQAVMACYDRAGLPAKSTLTLEKSATDLTQLSDLELAQLAEDAAARLRTLSVTRTHEAPTMTSAADTILH